MYERQETISFWRFVNKLKPIKKKKRKVLFPEIFDPIRMENSRDEVVHAYNYEDLKCIWKTSEVCIIIQYGFSMKNPLRTNNLCL